MTKIARLNAYANNMFVGLYADSPLKAQYLQKFFNEANNGLHGQAIISYYTELHKLKEYSPLYKGKNRLRDVAADVDSEAEKSPELKKTINSWLDKLSEDYPKSLKKRVFLAKHGFVVSDYKVVPHPWYMKLRSKLSPYISPYLSKILNNESLKRFIKILNSGPIE